MLGCAELARGMFGRGGGPANPLREMLSSRRGLKAGLIGSKADDVDTLIGVGRRNLLRSASRTAPSNANKLLLTFRKNTKERLAMKMRIGVWQGFPKERLKLNPKTGGSLPNMVALPHTHKDTTAEKRHKLRVSAIKWTAPGRHSFVPEDVPSSNEQRPTSKQPRLHKVKIESLADLHRSGMDSKALQTWLKIVAFGGCAQERDHNERTECHLPAMGKHATILLSAAFALKHGSTTALFKGITQAKTSKWQLAKSSSEKGCVAIDSLEDCRKFLLGIRQLPAMAGVQATFVRQSIASERGYTYLKQLEVTSGTWPKRRRCS